MTTTTTSTQTFKPWDLSIALQFANSFNLSDAASASAPPPPQTDNDNDGIFDFDDDVIEKSAPKYATDASKETDIKDFAQQPAPLGDFGKVWQFLGVPSSLPEPPTTTVADDTNKHVPRNDNYASDGAAYRRTRNNIYKPIQLSDASGEETGSPPAAAKALNKNQRKKARRKERKALEGQKKNNATVSESEADIIVVTQTPARKASSHHVATNQPPSTHGTPGTHSRPTPTISSTIQQINARLQAMGAPSSVEEAVNAVRNATANIEEGEDPSTPTPKPRVLPPHQKANVAPAASVLQGTTPATPASIRAHSLLPSSINPMLNGKSVSTNQKAFLSNQTPGNMPMPMPASATKPVAGTILPVKPTIQPQIVRSGEDRHWTLLMHIIAAFPEDRRNLVNPMNLTTHNNHPSGIHIFVDASNIFIGFMDQLKYARGIHPMTHMEPADLSFDALALLMERRRPVAKRELVGSTPHIAAFDTAKAVGYNCSILDKVYKARELTPRQIYFKELDARRYGRTSKKAPPCNAVPIGAGSPGLNAASGSGSGSGSETNTPQYARPAFVEQGVDEILHLKMMESLVDCEEPSTMVLATGDAAAAEYSAGFMMMVHRALKKGWTVELVSWSHGINGMYKKQEWTNAWGEQFRIIYLDDYAEELLDM